MARSKSNRPTQKVAAGALGGAITTIIVYLIRVVSMVELPSEVVAALTTLIIFAVSYLTPPGSNEVP